MSRDRAFSVFTALPAYTAAVAELPVSAALTDDMRGAVAVVPGTGDWWQGMLAARGGGASAVVLADPGVLPREAFESGRWPGDIPVIVERPRLRPDVAADAVAARRGSPARTITVECAAPAAGLGVLICDGFGWMRSLAGGSLALRSSIATVHSRIALLESGSYNGETVPATLSATAIGGLHAGGLLQVLALGEVRTEVTVDQPAGLARVETFTNEGVFRAPGRYESSARVALRRAIEASLSGGLAADLEDLLQDMALTRALLDA
ncbi:hypothetical protein [Pseudarthrobacter sp. MM222]|uniref:hypothetical protein n=1 Tax=Pseudarthrobacter sp. MM222 TaxID=3018929 RepID=UPI00221F584B|nr:hypothetical protein [Pseudarthrobacter sp. MM222]CAI3804300.1 hypothetical protein NKCBBBOE_03564 [Pseudarthrobacter sp. MM222]